MGQIAITPEMKLDEDLLEWEFVRSSGPGGQNVNKVATAVKLRLNLDACAFIFPEMRERLLHLAGRKVTSKGELVIDARRFRTQERNRQDALERLILLMKKAASAPKVRRPTRPKKASMKKIQAAKQRRREIKRLRRPVDLSDT